MFYLASFILTTIDYNKIAIKCEKNLKYDLTQIHFKNEYEDFGYDRKIESS